MRLHILKLQQSMSVCQLKKVGEYRDNFYLLPTRLLTVDVIPAYQT